MFYTDESSSHVNSYIILHLICECIKWTVAVTIADKHVSNIVSAITQHWFRQFGAPDMLIWDGEGAMNSDEARIWATRWNLDLVMRPKDKKAWIAERHHEILRVQLHKTQSQLASDNINLDFEQVLAEAVLAKNCLLSTGEGSPYLSLYGRVPRLLPQLDGVNRRGQTGGRRRS